MTSEGLKSAYLQGILSRGGRETGRFLEETYRARGDWRAGAASSGLDLEEILGDRDVEGHAPWYSMFGWQKFVELIKEYRRAMSWVDK